LLCGVVRIRCAEERVAERMGISERLMGANANGGER
jgi:hypothetical protein